MKRIGHALLLIVLVATIHGTKAIGEKTYDQAPPFGLDLLQPVKEKEGALGELFNPRNAYNVTINYELGMHCVGFDVSYCCIIPPYNSIQSQAIRSGVNGERPRLLSPDDVKLSYSVRDNSYSEGNKMRFWQVPKDVSGKGTMSEPNDSVANYVWDHLFIYKDLEGTFPQNPVVSKRLHIGRELPVNIDSGPSGKPLSGGNMDYAKGKGGNIVFTDSLVPDLKNVPLTLTPSYVWDALGLPLTAFNDSTRRGSIRTITDLDFQPYQYAQVQIRNLSGNPVSRDGKSIEFFGTEPIDIANCHLCHSGQGVAAKISRAGGLKLFDREYDYWKTKYPDSSDYYARVASASIAVLELHDARHKTTFLGKYDPDAAFNKLGAVGPVNCADCHGDNISGNLKIPRPGTTGYPGTKAMPLTEAIHSVHARSARMPDGGGRTQNCQACHPTHWQSRKMNDTKTNPYQITDDSGNPRFSDSDVRVSGGGCYLRRDAHTNPDVVPPFFLNQIGKWYLNEVSLRDEKGNPVGKMRGLYCTNCHNHLSHELYRLDDLRNVTRQEGKTIRNKPIGEVIQIIAGGDARRFRTFYADPVVNAEGEPLYDYYGRHKKAVLARTSKKGEKMEIFPWNSDKGKEVMYDDASGGSDWWLSPGEPHCADCHIAPFVESEGGKYFPIDQPNKYSLYRYSKAHGVLACQACHQSIHGLFPVRYEKGEETVDLTTHEQALQYSPDGKYAGPVTCAACHTVNKKGVPALLRGTDYYEDYWASVVLIHFMREGEEKMPLSELMKKHPYPTSREIVAKGFK